MRHICLADSEFTIIRIKLLEIVTFIARRCINSSNRMLLSKLEGILTVLLTIEVSELAVKIRFLNVANSFFCEHHRFHSFLILERALVMLLILFKIVLLVIETIIHVVQRFL